MDNVRTYAYFNWADSETGQETVAELLAVTSRFPDGYYYLCRNGVLLGHEENTDKSVVYCPESAAPVRGPCAIVWIGTRRHHPMSIPPKAVGSIRTPCCTSPTWAPRRIVPLSRWIRAICINMSPSFEVVGPTQRSAACFNRSLLMSRPVHSD